MKFQKSAKKIFGILLALAMVMTAMPASVVFAAGDGQITLTAPSDEEGGYVDLGSMTAKAYKVLDEEEGDDTLFTVNSDFAEFFQTAQETYYKDCVENGAVKDGVDNLYFTYEGDKLVLSTTKPGTEGYIEVKSDSVKSLVYNESESKYFAEAIMDAILRAGAGSGEGLIDTENAATLAEWLRKYAVKNGVTPENGTLQDGKPDKIVFSPIELGYWLVVSENAPSNVANVETVFRLSQREPEFSAQLKLETQILDKKVKKEGDRDYADATTAGMGDILNYQATMNIPDLFEYDGNELTEVGKTAKDYVYKITDTMENQRLVDAGKNAVADDAPISMTKGAFTVTITWGDGGDNQKVVFKDVESPVPPVRALNTILKDTGSSYGTYEGEQQEFVLDFDIEKLRTLEMELTSKARWKEAKLTLEYNAELTSDAVWQNDNDIGLDYSNDPKTTADKPLNDHTKVYTYGLDIQKNFEGTPDGGVDAAYKDVAFELYHSDDGKTVKGTAIEMTGNDGDYNVADSEALDPVTELKLGSDGSLHIYGLDTGYYILEETKTHQGYAKVGKIVVYIEANADGTYTISTSSSAAEGDVDLEASTEDGGTRQDLSFEVLNRAGMHLPQTGGPGVLMLLIGGVALITLAAAMIIYRRKNSAE